MKKLGSVATAKGGSYKKNNAMTPLNWGVGIAETALMSGVIASDDAFVKISCISIVIAVLLFYGYVYNHFMIKDPDRLQSEDYNIRTQELTLLHDETDISAPILSVESNLPIVQSIENKKS